MLTNRDNMQLLEVNRLFGERLRTLRKEKGLTQIQFAKDFHIATGTVAMWETSKRMPDSFTLSKLADYFGVSVDYILGREDEKTLHLDNVVEVEFIERPVLGSIACGEPILAEQNIEEYAKVPADMPVDFFLRCVGDSMTGARIFDGDLVGIRIQPQVENGEIAAVQLDDDGTATLKRVQRAGDTLILLPENAAYAPLVYSGAELEGVRILGKAVYFISMVR